MDGSNPYEAPRADLTPVPSDVDSATAFEKKVAARLLEIHERGAYSLGLFLRWNVWRYAFGVVYFGVALLLLARLELWDLFYLMAGLFIGMILRDLNWVYATSKGWPLQNRVMDWEKVRRIAES